MYGLLQKMQQPAWLPMRGNVLHQLQQLQLLLQPQPLSQPPPMRMTRMIRMMIHHELFPHPKIPELQAITFSS
jgi:hypothetical protein